MKYSRFSGFTDFIKKSFFCVLGSTFFLGTLTACSSSSSNPSNPKTSASSSFKIASPSASQANQANQANQSSNPTPIPTITAAPEATLLPTKDVNKQLGQWAQIVTKDQQLVAKLRVLNVEKLPNCQAFDGTVIHPQQGTFWRVEIEGELLANNLEIDDPNKQFLLSDQDAFHGLTKEWDIAPMSMSKASDACLPSNDRFPPALTPGRLEHGFLLLDLDPQTKYLQWSPQAKIGTGWAWKLP